MNLINSPLTPTPPDGQTCAVNLKIGEIMKICVMTKIFGIESPSAGEFIRYIF